MAGRIAIVLAAVAVAGPVAGQAPPGCTADRANGYRVLSLRDELERLHLHRSAFRDDVRDGPYITEPGESYGAFGSTAEAVRSVVVRGSTADAVEADDELVVGLVLLVACYWWREERRDAPLAMLVVRWDGEWPVPIAWTDHALNVHRY